LIRSGLHFATCGFRTDAAIKHVEPPSRADYPVANPAALIDGRISPSTVTATRKSLEAVGGQKRAILPSGAFSQCRDVPGLNCLHRVAPSHRTPQFLSLCVDQRTFGLRRGALTERRADTAGYGPLECSVTAIMPKHDHHKATAQHHEAAKLHRKAAEAHEHGDTEQASQHSQIANDHSAAAHEASNQEHQKTRGPKTL